MASTDAHTPELRIVDAEANNGYALSGKIMLTAIVVLFAVVLFMVGLHLYARWYLVRLRRRQLETRRQRRMASRSEIMTYLDRTHPAAAASAADRGLDRPVLNSLPVHLHAADADAAQECAVCLSEFSDGEIVRLLPKCNHSFHLECIDMWFGSHSTCPLCRSPVEYVPEKSPANPVRPNPVQLNPVQPGAEPGSTSSGKGEVRIEIPPERGFDRPENELTPASRRLLALKRILSMGRRSPAGGGAAAASGGESTVGVNGLVEEGTV